MYVENALRPTSLPITIATPLWKKSLKVIGWVAITALSYFVADWLGVAACSIAYIATFRKSPLQSAVNTPSPTASLEIIRNDGDQRNSPAESMISETEIVPSPRVPSSQSDCEPRGGASPQSILTQILNIPNAPPPQLAMLQTIDPSFHSPNMRNGNKVYAYQIMTGEQPLIEKRIQLEKLHILQLPGQPFLDEVVKITPVVGRFTYPPNIHHWTANFGFEEVLFGSITGRLKQAELQILEHPALVHVYAAIKNNLIFGKLDTTGSALLIEGAKRYGQLNQIDRFLWGQFRTATFKDIERSIELFAEPQESNIFIIAAPNIHPKNEDTTYTYKVLRGLFCSAYAAFSRIAKKDPLAVIHTGNWGCGDLFHDPKTIALIQIAAAKLAGIKEMCYYPMGKERELEDAQKILREIENRYRYLSAEGFLRHIRTYASGFNLWYRFKG